ncbi:MAG: F0F1 ATP synthase subunit delta [Spirochaetaceae bacterium]|nr:F0F1 ATP synthase subunit delta [Spirochaetaceae bacterium]
MKLAADRWAEAFIEACEEGFNKDAARPADTSYKQTETGFSVLKSSLYCLLRLPNTVSGSVAAAQFDVFLRAALKKCGYDGKKSGIEAACAMVFLLIKRGHIPQSGLLIDKIEDLLLKKRRILTVLLDCAEKPDDVFVESVKKAIKEREKVEEVRITVVLTPELVGGYRINIGDDREDFSVLGQMKQMEQLLAGAV